MTKAETFRIASPAEAQKIAAALIVAKQPFRLEPYDLEASWKLTIWSDAASLVEQTVPSGFTRMGFIISPF